MISLLVLLCSFNLLNGATITCDERQADIVIIVDSSWPISNEDFTVARGDIVKSVQAITVSRDPGSEVKENSALKFNLDSYNSKKPMTDDGRTFNASRPQSYAEVVLIDIGNTVNQATIQLLASVNSQVAVKTYQELVRDLKDVIIRACYLPDQIVFEPCTAPAQDLVFLIDLSSSLTEDDFVKSKEFVKTFIKSVKLSPDDTRVAMLSFSDSVRLDFNLDMFTKLEDYIRAVDGMERFGSATAIGKALQMTLANVLPKRRSEVPFNVVLLTDGKNNVFPKSTVPATELKNRGVNIVTVAIGNDVDMVELKAVASPNKTVAHGNYSELMKNIVQVQKKVICG